MLIRPPDSHVLHANAGEVGEVHGEVGWPHSPSDLRFTMCCPAVKFYCFYLQIVTQLVQLSLMLRSRMCSSHNINDFCRGRIRSSERADGIVITMET